MIRLLILVAATLSLAPLTLEGASPPGTPRTRPAAVPGDTTMTTMFEVDGIRVILRRNPSNEVVVANLYLLGGARQLTPRNAGIEGLMLLASERGTRRFPGATLRQRTARLGSRITVGAEEDWSVIGLRSIRTTFEDTWELMADRVIAPTFDPGEVATVQEQLVIDARQRRLEPDDAAEALADSLLYVSHPYSIEVAGTAASLASLTVPQLRRYHAEQTVRSRMLVVVVGNVEQAQVARLVHASLARLPAGSYRWTPPPPPVVSGSAIAFEHRALPTNYLLGYVAGPPATSDDYTALRVATAVLSGRLFTEVRSRRNLSYAVEAPFLERAHAVAGLYVTTTDPNAVLRLMRSELDALQQEEVDPIGLRRLEQQFITEYYLKNETNADQANVLARALLYQGDFRAADRFMAQLHRVRPSDVRRAAERYMTGIRFAYVGDTTRVDRALLRRF